MINIKEIRHPLTLHYLTIIRDNKTNGSNFKYALEKISYILASDVYSGLSTKERSVTTPLKKSKGFTVTSKIVLLPILRAGLGLVQGFIDLLPTAIISHIGLYRDEESLKPIKYYFKFPQFKAKENLKVIVLDPMVATGGSSAYTIEYLLNMGIRDINLVCLICAPEGIKAIEKRFGTKQHKYIKIITCSIDEKLNDKGFILPGLGDAGDRLFGTSEIL
jgi:uracil phosphoribosyltransferase